VGTKLASLVTKANVEHAEAVEEAASRSEVDPRDYVARNKEAWERWAPARTAAAREAWDGQMRWGIWGVPEAEARLLDGIEPQTHVIELGCGTAAISSWLVRLGLQPIGVDLVRAQLEAAARLQHEFGISFGLLRANAEQLHFEDGSFGMAVSEYGVSLWCDPRRWLPEAHRLLRPRGRLIMVTSSPLLQSCKPWDGSPVREWLVRDHFGPDRLGFSENGAVEFHLTHGEWVRALSKAGFVVENLIEVQPSPDARARVDLASLEWARRWPTEDIWVLRKAD
jgi:SAM-dependent methyltransferase